MKVTLINPPWHFKRGLTNFSQNLGLSYVASYLLAHGHQVEIIDALAEGYNIATKVPTEYGLIYRIGLTYQDIVNRIAPDSGLIGITGPFNHNARIIAELSKVMKQRYPNKPIILGGAYPSSLPGHALTEDVDYVIVGEGEIPMLQLAEGIEPKNIKGLVFRDANNGTMDNGKASVIDNLDDIPFPARQLLPFDKYFRISPRGWRDLRTVSIITSRGCPFDCNFCSIHAVYGYKWRTRSPENVLREIEDCLQNYNIEHIEFEDDNLTLNKDRAAAIFDGLKYMSNKLGRKIVWSASNGFRLDTLDESLLRKMKESNCSSMILALEHGDPAILEAMNKRLDLAKVEEVAKICKQLKLNIHMFLMVGYPGETKESFLEGLRFAERVKKLGNIKRFWVFTTKPVAGTRLAEYCEQHNMLAHSLIPEVEVAFLNEDYGGIITKDFDLEEIKSRRRYAERKLNPFGYTFALKWRQFIIKFMPYWLISSLQMIQRKLGW